MKIKVGLMLLGCFCILSAPASATIIMTANDPMATSSFNSAGKWSDGQAPSAGNTYSTVGYLMRTPSVAGNYTFAGDQLTVGGGDGGGANPFLTNGYENSNALINKTPNSPIITVNDLILDAGTVRDGMGSADTWTLDGNINVTSNGGGLVGGCTFNVQSKITGSGTLYVGDNGSGEAARTLYIKSSANTYDGNVLLLGQTEARCRLTFADNSLMNFTIGASGVNNRISGTGTIAYNGDFKFNLDSAGAGLGDSWTISNTTSQTFSDTFAVQGFYSNLDGDTWTKEIESGKYYRFRESAGMLDVVPEPASWLMIVSGAITIAFYIRRKR